MNELMPAGTYPTPYGVSVPIFPPDEPNADYYGFDLEGTMTCAGIHDPAARARCREAVMAVNAGNGMPGAEFLALCLDHGGCRPPHMVLPPVGSADSAYNDIPESFEAREVIDNWIDRIAELHRWCDRARHFQEMLDAHVELLNGTTPHEDIAFGLSRMLTAVFENLGETEIDCLEAAAFYALSSHEAWRKAAVEWLQPFRRTWWADWIKARPKYRRFARMTLKIHRDVPSWLAGGVR
jgi:hypothetical protein